MVGDIYRLLADLFGTGVVIGIVGMEIRRFIIRPKVLTARESIKLDPRARAGILRDSAIVAAFIFVHVSSRLLGESMYLAQNGIADSWQPIATTIAGLMSGMNGTALEIGQHVSFWLSLGAIVAFLPYFPYSKHIHLFFSPINHLLKPERKSIGE